MRATAAFLALLCLCGCADTVVQDYHRFDGSAITNQQLAAARKTCQGAKDDRMAAMSDAPVGAKADGAYTRNLRAQVNKEAAGRDEEAVCMLKQDVFPGKATKPVTK